MSSSKRVVLLLLSAIFLWAVVEPLECPSPIFNKFVKCSSSINQDNCPPDTYLVPDGSFCGLCPGCRGGQGLKKSCNVNNPGKQCAPGLACSKQLLCELDRDKCAHTYHLPTLPWIPKCNVDSTFEAFHCKGDPINGRCFCHDEYGQRIHGWSWWRDNKDMTCACSRHRVKLEKQGRHDVTLHCSPNGSYESLQCDSGVCWCAQPKSGQQQVGTVAVPETMWQLLPCYNATLMGDKYLRQCESASHAQKVMGKRLAIHGTNIVSVNNILCDYDGSYGAYSINDGTATCLWRDGERIGSFAVQSNQVAQMKCYCARDQKYYIEDGLKLTLLCSGNGNYAPLQDLNGKMFCVDRDGFAVSDFYDKLEEDECDQFLYYKY